VSIVGTISSPYGSAEALLQEWKEDVRHLDHRLQRTEAPAPDRIRATHFQGQPPNLARLTIGWSVLFFWGLGLYIPVIPLAMLVAWTAARAVGVCYPQV
jgi:hypothetical protein